MLVNTSVNTQGSVMMAITKMKQLLNYLSYLVMANTANAFIFRCLVVCVIIFASVHSQRKSAFLINSSLNRYCVLFSFRRQRYRLALPQQLIFLMTQMRLPKMAEWPCCMVTVCHWVDLTHHPAPLSASHLPLATQHITPAFSGQWEGLGYQGDTANRQTSC